MKIWRLGEQLPVRAARLSRRGTWVNPEKRPLCSGCTRSFQRRVSPLIVEWEHATGPQVADITPAGFGSDFALTPRAVEALAPFTSWRAGAVEVRDAPPDVNLPPLTDLITDAEVSADVDMSSMEVENHCEVCGTTTWELSGAEHIDWTQGEDGPIRLAVERQDVGVVVRRADLAGDDIFRLAQFPGWIVVTDAVRVAITRADLKGVRFLAIGTVLE